MADGQNRSLRPRARIVRTLGSELISNEQIAIVELVKNAYDADATQVIVRFVGPLVEHAGEVEVWDDGHGMSAGTVDAVWSEIATPYRLEAIKSESGKRRVLGEKGIGRLAASRLGDVTNVITKRPSGEEVSLVIDWRDFTDERYLDEVTFNVAVVDPPRTFGPLGEAESLFHRPLASGTAVRTSGLGRRWEDTDFDSLRLALSRLLPPRPAEELASKTRSAFSIWLDLPEETNSASGEVGANDVLARPHYQVVGSVDASGRAHLTYRDSLTDEESQIDEPIRVSGGADRMRRPRCGPLEVDLRAWDLDRDTFEATKGSLRDELSTLSKFREDIKSRSGVAVYRDGFRVQPFGDATFDWLHLDSRRVNNPTMRLSNNQVSGFVFISADANPGLRDRSHREGMIDTAEYEDFQQVTTQLVALLEAPRRASARRAPKSKSRPSTTGIFSYFSLDRLTGLAASRSADRDLVEAIDEVTAQVGRGVEEVKQTLARFSRLATLGSIVDLILHEGRGSLSRIRTGVAGVLGKTPAAAQLSGSERITKYGPRIERGAATLSDLFSRIEPLAGKKRSAPKLVGLSELVEPAVELMSARAKHAGVVVTTRVVDSSVTVDPGEITQVVVNLLDNAIYWAGTVDDETSRAVLVEAVPLQGGGASITVSDSGPGVPSEFEEAIFDAYFSLKPQGTGLGLAIAGATIQDFYEGSLLLMKPGELPGARFRATLRSQADG